MGAGGAIGALLRWGLAGAMAVDTWPAATLVANLLGAFLLALLSARLRSSAVAVGVRRGLLGAFTTFSALVVGVVELADRPLVAVAYLLSSLLGGLVVVAMGLRLGGARGVR